jgi:hypothetical protein
MKDFHKIKLHQEEEELEWMEMDISVISGH